MNVLARARGLQERIRPVYTRFQVKKRATFAPLKGERNTRPGVKKSSWSERVAPASKLSTREAGRIILNLLHIGEGVPPHSPSPI